MNNEKLAKRELLRWVEQRPYLALYGAGKIGVQSLAFLRAQGVHPNAFLVSCIQDGQATEGLPVYTPQTLPFAPEQTTVLFTVSPLAFESIEKELQQAGFDRYRPLDFGISDVYVNDAPILEITTRIGCAVNCVYCPQQLLVRRYFEGNPDRPPVMTVEVFEKCLSSVPQEVQITFSGMAESWLNPDCTQMVLCAHQKGHRVAVYTTLRGMTESNFEAMQDLPFCDFVLHIPDAQEHADIPVTDTYLRLLKKVLACRRGAFPLVTDLSCHGTPHPKIRDLVGRDWDGGEKMQDRAGNLDTQTLKHHCKQGALACLRSRNRHDRNILLPDGTVLLCCMDYGLRHPLGNLLETPYPALWDGEPMRALQHALSGKDCDALCRSCVDAVPETFLKKWYERR